jgi:hypothetical protein
MSVQLRGHCQSSGALLLPLPMKFTYENEAGDPNGIRNQLRDFASLRDFGTNTWQFARYGANSKSANPQNRARLCGSGVRLCPKSSYAREVVRDGSGIEQLKFAEYLISGRPDPNHTFRQHVRQIGGDRRIRPTASACRTFGDYEGDRCSSVQRIQAHPMSSDNAVAVGNPK